MSTEDKKEGLKSRSLGLKLMGKFVIKKLIRWMEKGAAEWEVPLDSIVMQMKLLNNEPRVLIKETHENKKSLNLTEKLGTMEAIGKIAFKKLLISVEIMAEEWDTSVDHIRLDLKMVDKQPEVKVIEENGQRRTMEFVM